MKNDRTQKKRVFVVDDSAFMRKALTRIIESDGKFEVVGSAKSGDDALQELPVAMPDVITLDVEMPGKSGLETLSLIRQSFAVPVIMVSSITRAGSDLAIQCLHLGALDIVCKPESYVSMRIGDISHDLLVKLAMATGIDRVATPPALLTAPDQEERSLETFVPPPALSSQKVVTIGSSTGGPMALNQLLSRLPKAFPAGIVIVQHMPPGGFIQSLAERLHTQSHLQVRVAEDGDLIKDGLALIAPIGQHLKFQASLEGFRVRLSDTPEGSLHCPSVDVLFESAGKAVGRNNISCILTGMGSDGTAGLAWVKRNGGHVIAQSEKTCAIFGMPRCAIDAGHADEVKDLTEIPESLIRRLSGPKLN